MTHYEERKNNTTLDDWSSFKEECPQLFKGSTEQFGLSNGGTKSKDVTLSRGQINHLVTFKGLESRKVANGNGIVNSGESITNQIEPKKSVDQYRTGNTHLILNEINNHDIQTEYSNEEFLNKKHSNIDKHVKSYQNKFKEGKKSTQSKHVKKDKPPFKYAGIVASLICALFFSIQSVAIKLLPNPHDISEKAKALFFRGFFILGFCTLTCLYNKTSLRVPREEIWVVFLRCITGAISQFGAFSALAFISAADSKAIIFTAPIWTSIASRIVFNDPFKLIQVFALPASMFGIVLVAHPSLIVGDDSPLLAEPLLDSSILYKLTNITLEPQNDWLMNLTGGDDGFTREKRWIGFVISLGVSLMATANYIVLTFRRKTPVQTCTFWLGLTVLGTSLTVMAVTGYGSIPDTIQEWIILVTIGFTAWIGQSLLQWAFFYERADILSIVRTTDVAFTFMLSALVLDEPLYGTSIIGALIITSVVILIILNDLVTKFFSSFKNYAIINDDQMNNDDLDSKNLQIYTISNGKSHCSGINSSRG